MKEVLAHRRGEIALEQVWPKPIDVKAIRRKVRIIPARLPAGKANLICASDLTSKEMITTFRAQSFASIRPAAARSVSLFMNSFGSGCRFALRRLAL
jgi:hypothetical protein